MKLFCRGWAGCVLLALSCAGARAQTAAYQPPEEIAFRQATIISEGSRLSAEVFTLRGKEE